MNTIWLIEGHISAVQRSLQGERGFAENNFTFEGRSAPPISWQYFIPALLTFGIEQIKRVWEFIHALLEIGTNHAFDDAIIII